MTSIKRGRARRAKLPGMYQRILVATDGSAQSAQAMRDAIALARALGAQLCIFHAVPHYPAGYFEGRATSAPGEVARTEGAWVDRGQALVDAACAEAAAAGVAATPVLQVTDRVGESLVEAARSHACDLVVMASHGRGGLSRLLLGSETQYVLAHAGLPVLVLR